MRKTPLVLALLAGAAAMAGAITDDQQNALTAIDAEEAAQKDQLDTLFGGSATALTTLEDIALGTQATSDPYGTRLRAIYALSSYCASTPCAATDDAHVKVMSLVTTNQSAHTGADLLILRAAIESLGKMKVPSDGDSTTGPLVPLLSHSSRDIRAATARALGSVCNTTAATIQALRDRYQQEPTDQVRLAISDALGALATCTPP